MHLLKLSLQFWILVLFFSLSQFLPHDSQATITYAIPVPKNGTWSKPSPAFPAPNSGLPELCAVAINVISSPTSSYNFGLFLPTEWNTRFLTSGNGGFGGGINWNDMGTSALSGFVGLSTDTGHLSASGDASWALNNPETQTDWGYRAMHGSVVLGKAITEGYYRKKISYSYYSACSTGGRQGLKEIQMFPEDFDGVVAAAPAWWTSRLQPWSLQVGLWNLPADSPTHIPSSLFPIIAKEVMRQCDPQDGVIDGIIQTPFSCEFIPSELLCTPGKNTSTCLTAPQLKTLYKFYHDWTDSDNNLLFPSYPLGSESQSPFLLNTDSSIPSSYGTSWISSMVLNLSSSTSKSYNWSSSSSWNTSTVHLGDTLNPGHANADNFDISPFALRGGKLIHYHGLSDGLIPATSSLYFHSQVLSTLLPSSSLPFPISNFYKFYLIPGMLHCSSSVGDAPWYINGGGQAFNLGDTVTGVPGFEEGGGRFDVLKAVMRWVEEGVEPEELVATKWVDDDVRKGVRRQRKICPYPQTAVWDGVGDVDGEGSWGCKGMF
ncbi:feruloyl esteras-like protein B precursor [Cadophora sp. DSE1049]|nr:feruloyl esteras-like protein B precursor [Cadophora sp. DSE1049]